MDRQALLLDRCIFSHRLQTILVVHKTREISAASDQYWRLPSSLIVRKKSVRISFVNWGSRHSGREDDDDDVHDDVDDVDDDVEGGKEEVKEDILY